MAKRGNHEGTIFKRSNGTWGAAIQVQGKRSYIYGKTRKEVQEKLAPLQQEARSGVVRPRESPKTVGEYLNFWLNEVIAVRPRTREHYDLCVRRMLPYIGALKLATLGPGELVSLWARLKAKGLSNQTVKLCHGALHNALQVAVQWRYIPGNPADMAKPPRVERREMRTLTSEQVRKLFGITKGDRWHALWVLFVTTGLRMGEVTALRWSDLDFEKGRAVVQRLLQRQRGVGLVFAEPKSKSSVRSVILTPAVIDALNEHRQWVLKQRTATGDAWQDLDLIFPSLRGGPVDPARVSTAFHLALLNAGLPRVRPHDLRHTSATLLLEAGIHPKVMQEMLGHSSIALTLGTYSHVMPRLHDEAAQALQGLLFEDPGNGQVKSGKRAKRREESH